MYRHGRPMLEEPPYPIYVKIAFIGAVVFLVIFAIVYQTTWQVSNTYKFIRVENRVTPTAQDKTAFDNIFKDSKM